MDLWYNPNVHPGFCSPMKRLLLRKSPELARCESVGARQPEKFLFQRNQQHFISGGDFQYQKIFIPKEMPRIRIPKETLRRGIPKEITKKCERDGFEAEAPPYSSTLFERTNCEHAGRGRLMVAHASLMERRDPG
ncbi:hypothetical protein CEXT_254071 [Caerostris extrusa]|uniref:Uncharacterized protein n=1 Tax=Caerostris extrusa TaxID=172846 RepID=A0AAV4SPZ7_CAEEX|nr:hypothetical protein CEXT_254071 [Caerostris extrusa]